VEGPSAGWMPPTNPQHPGLVERLSWMGDQAGVRNGHGRGDATHRARLDRRGVAEATFYLGGSATRNDRYQEALQWMLRAEQLNPATGKPGSR
jgi:hypothetical protein